MKIKNILTSIIAGASLLAFAGAGMAETTTYSGGGTSPAMPTADVNIWGASAEYTFFKREFPNFLGSNGAGCTLGVSGATSDGKNFFQQANCNGITVNFRVSSKSSYDGPLAIDGNTTQPNRTTTCSDPTQRPFADTSLCPGGICPNGAVPGVNNCYPVTIGASDVEVQDFVQISNGAQFGPFGNLSATGSSGSTQARNFLVNPVTVSGNVTDLCRPLAIPFAFYVNSSVTTTAGTVLNNITSSEAKMIFSGVLKDWSDLQSTAMNAQPIMVCYRHAGSGTHATLDAWMKPNTLLKTAVTGGTSAHYYFNDGSSDEMYCVNGANNGTTSWSGTGAIGYADADQSLNNYTATSQLTLDGVAPLTANVENYTYPFFTIENLYVATANTSNGTLNDICTYMAQPSKLQTPPSELNWAASCNMLYTKNTNFGNFLFNTAYHNSNCN